MTTIRDQRLSSLCCWSELFGNRLSETGAGKTPAAGAFASGHLFSAPGSRQHVCLMAVCRCSPAAPLCVVPGSLGRTPLFGLQYRPCRLGPPCTYSADWSRWRCWLLCMCLYAFQSGRLHGRVCTHGSMDQGTQPRLSFGWSVLSFPSTVRYS